MILTDEQKQAITDKYGACNWEVLEAAARRGAIAAFTLPIEQLPPECADACGNCRRSWI